MTGVVCVVGDREALIEYVVYYSYLLENREVAHTTCPSPGGDLVTNMNNNNNLSLAKGNRDLGLTSADRRRLI